MWKLQESKHLSRISWLSKAFETGPVTSTSFADFLEHNANLQTQTLDYQKVEMKIKFKQTIW